MPRKTAVEMPDRVAAVLASYPPRARARVQALRALVLATAKAYPAIGPLEETLKWGEPAYLTTESGSGSTIRIAWKKGAPQQVAMYVNCKTTLIDSFRTHFPGVLTLEGDRAIIFDLDAPLPRDVLVSCIATALLYHRLGRGTLAPGSRRATAPPCGAAP